jgi:hypothetical protein
MLGSVVEEQQSESDVEVQEELAAVTTQSNNNEEGESGVPDMSSWEDIKVCPERFVPPRSAFRRPAAMCAPPPALCQSRT